MCSYLKPWDFLSLPFLSCGFCLLLLPALVSELTCCDSAAVLLIQLFVFRICGNVALNTSPVLTEAGFLHLGKKKITGKRIMTGLLGFALSDGQRLGLTLSA